MTIAVYAIRQYRDGQKSSQRELMAYVDISHAAYDRAPDEPNARWEIDIVFKNFGQTPARNVIIKVETTVGPKRDESKVFEFTPAAKTQSPTRIAPGNQLIVSGPPGIKPGDAGFTGAGNAKLHSYIWGEISYLDVFDRLAQVRFQMVCEFSRGVQSFSYCEAGNTDRLPGDS